MRFHEATAEFREAVRLNPQYVPAQQALAVGYFITQNPALAWRQVELLRKDNVNLPEDFLQQLSKALSEADAAKQQEEIEKNLAAAQQAASEHPDNPALLAALAAALNKAGDYPAAQRAANQALQLDPNQAEAHLLLGSILGGSHQPPSRPSHICKCISRTLHTHLKIARN
jgi:tetratricopeptide (TPR) repeat protein